MPTTRNIRLTLAYDGTNYVGWQVQKNGLGIQTVLECAIEELTGEKCPVLSAGRTDSGVHALGQVANFHTTSTIPAKNFRPALQDFLPHDIVILDACEVPPEFHATFKATRKQYRYLIDNSPVPLPFLSKYTWSLRRRLDVPAMNEAAQLILGTHDFRSFETDWPNKVTSIRTVFEISVTRQPLWHLLTSNLLPVVSPPLRKGGQGGAGEDVHTRCNTPRDVPGDIISLEITADGFLYNMVRSIVGTLVNVGRDKWDNGEIARILAAQNRSLAGSTAPACGLFLVQVWYD